jgi:hypothetical protein
LYLVVHLISGRDVLRFHLGHHKLSEHLNLLHLRQRDLVAYLDRLQVADSGLVLELKTL